MDFLSIHLVYAKIQFLSAEKQSNPFTFITLLKNFKPAFGEKRLLLSVSGSVLVGMANLWILFTGLLRANSILFIVGEINSDDKKKKGLRVLEQPTSVF